MSSGSPSCQLASNVNVILDGDREAQEWKPFPGVDSMLGLRRLATGAFGSHDAERVQLTVEARDPIQIQLDEVRRCDLPIREHADLIRRTREDRPRHVH
jgi:hypothetical protein